MRSCFRDRIEPCQLVYLVPALLTWSGRQSFESDEPSALACQNVGFSTGEVSPDRVDLMLLDEEMRTRSLPSWMRNKNKGKLQDASQHPVNVTANILTYLL